VGQESFYFLVRKNTSSFSEEKEAKRLLIPAAWPFVVTFHAT
jgi:hypothetical protein